MGIFTPDDRDNNRRITYDLVIPLYSTVGGSRPATRTTQVQLS